MMTPKVIVNHNKWCRCHHNDSVDPDDDVTGNTILMSSLLDMEKVKLRLPV